MSRLNISVKSIKNNRIYTQCQIRDFLEETEKWYSVEGVIDTGANTCCISESFAKKINVCILGTSPVGYILEHIDMEYCFMDLRIGNITFDSIKTFIFPNPCFDSDFIIGMDILGQGAFTFKKVKDEYEFNYRISQGALLDMNIRNKVLLNNRIKNINKKYYTEK